MPGIRIEGLRKAYAGRAVLDRFDLELPDGGCFTLLGPSGCGKTVLMRLLAGFEPLDAGRISIGDTVVADAATGAHLAPNERSIGMVFQDYAVWPHMTVFDNVAYPLKIAKVAAAEKEQRTQAVIAQVGLTGLEQRLPSQLSGGQQQRVALARALVSRPQVLLLDEPLNNLDANLREEMRFEIRALQQKLGITVLYVTHDQEIALAIADLVAVMDEGGALRQVGTPQQLYDHPADPYVFRFLGVANFLALTRSAAGWRLADGSAWTGAAPAVSGDRATAGFRPGDVELARDGEGLGGTVRRASYLGAQVDFLVEVAGTTLRAAIDSRQCLDRGLMFVEGEACRVRLRTVQWFDSDAVEQTAAQPANAEAAR